MNLNEGKSGIKKDNSGNDLIDMKQAQAFDDTASKVFAPIYPVIPRQILDRTGISGGVALDAGAGPAHL